MRLNKFVRRLHDMLQSEDKLGIVEWRRGLLVLHSTDAFAKTVLPKYFNTRNFKTFRRQLNYYGFVHVRSFSTTTPSPTSLGSGSSGGDLSSTCTALWVHRELAQLGAAAVNISSVLNLHRVEPCESSKTAEGRRARKELAVSTVEEDIGVDAKTLQLEQIQAMAFPRAVSRTPMTTTSPVMKSEPPFYMHYQNNTPLLPRETSDYESAANLLLMLSKSVVC
jgi:HSF-type DNA-binding